MTMTTISGISAASSGSTSSSPRGAGSGQLIALPVPVPGPAASASSDRSSAQGENAKPGVGETRFARPRHSAGFIAQLAAQSAAKSDPSALAKPEQRRRAAAAYGSADALGTAAAATPRIVL